MAAIFSAESLKRIGVPVGLVSARLDTVLVPRFHSDHVLAHCKRCELLADLPAGHFDVLWPWPGEVAKAVAAQQWRGGEPTLASTPHCAKQPTSASWPSTCGISGLEAMLHLLRLLARTET